MSEAIDSKTKSSKTKTSFYRRLYVAHLIDQGINTVPAIMDATGMPRRTAQDTISALEEIDIECKFIGANKDGNYEIRAWGAIDKKWIDSNIQCIKKVLVYP